MYLSTITLKNFRKYAYDGADKHGITVNFHKGLNALIGENDSGKSAIIDAIKLVLQTQSGEFTRVSDEDFYISTAGEIAAEFSIDCTFEGFEINEAKNFIEWLSFEKDKISGAVFYKLFLHYRAWRENGRIYGDLFLAERLVRKLLSKILHYSGIDDAEGKAYGSISVKRYISRNFSQKYQSAILGLAQHEDFAYSSVEGKIKEILTELLGAEWIKNVPAAFMQLSQDTQVPNDNNHIFIDECCIPIVFDTVYGVKGETHDATLYLETETKQNSDIRRILPLLERKIRQCKNELQEKSRRCVYVGFSRPKHLLALAISEKTYVGHEAAFSSWKILDLRSEVHT